MSTLHVVLCETIKKHVQENTWRILAHPRLDGMIRMNEAEMIRLTRRAHNIRYLDERREKGLSLDMLPFPASGSERQRWCLFCEKQLEKIQPGANPRATRFRPCQCENSMRYGRMEVDAEERRGVYDEPNYVEV